MPIYARYKKETGQVLGFTAMSELSLEALLFDLDLNPDTERTLLDPTEHMIVVDDSAPQNSGAIMVVDGKIAARPRLYPHEVVAIAADGIMETALPLPAGTRFVFQDREHQAGADEVFEFSSAKAGSWTVTIAPPFPYQIQTLEIVAE